MSGTTPSARTANESSVGFFWSRLRGAYYVGRLVPRPTYGLVFGFVTVLVNSSRVTLTSMTGYRRVMSVCACIVVFRN